MRTVKPVTINVSKTSTKTFYPAKLHSVDVIKKFTLLKNDNVVVKRQRQRQLQSSYVKRWNAMLKRKFVII